MKYEAAYVKYMDTKIDNIGYREIYDIVSTVIKNERRGYICITDVGNVIAATKDKQLRIAINESLLSVADGMPLAWYGWLVGCKKLERITGMDLMVRLFEERDGYKHYLLGDTNQTLNKVVNKARTINEDIRIAFHSPPFADFNDEENRLIIDKIRDAAPEFIWVSFGGGKQEKWMWQNIKKIEKGVMIGVGSAFRWFVGDIRPPPEIFQKLGLQWLFRMVQGIVADPKEGFKFLIERQVKKFPLFIISFPFEVMKCRKKLSSLPKQE